jgi:hypothetical protein
MVFVLYSKLALAPATRRDHAEAGVHAKAWARREGIFLFLICGGYPALGPAQLKAR